MQANEITNQVKVYSQSALHTFITGPEPLAQKSRSKTNPYRKRQGFLSFLGITEVLAEVKREEAVAHEAKIAQRETKTEIETDTGWNLGQVSEA